MKMNIVIDIQCVKDYKNRAIPKEVAVLSLNLNFTGHWTNRQIITLCQEPRKGAGQRGRGGQLRQDRQSADQGRMNFSTEVENRVGHKVGVNICENRIE